MSFPRYPDYKATGLEWLPDVPTGWEIRRLKQFCTVFPSNVDKKSIEGEALVKLCNYTDVYYNDSISAEMEFMDATAPEEQVKKFALRAGDVIITKDSETADDIAIAAYVPKTLPGVICGYHLSMLRPRADVNGLYVKRVFDSIYAKSLFAVRANGLTRVGLSQYAVDNVELPLPPSHEQLAIATFLDHETAKIDALIAEQKRLIELLQEKRQAVISHAVTKGLNPDAPMKDSGVEWLGDVPEHWDIAAVGHRYSVQLGKMLDANQQTGNHSKPYLRVADVQWGVINTEDLPEMDFPPEAEARYRLKAGDLLVNEGGSYVGRSAIWSVPLGECYYQKALHRLRAYEATKDSPHFMYCLMEHATRLGVFIAGGNQTTIDHLTAEQLRRYRFAFPPMQEQEHIASYLRLKTDRLQQLTTQAESMVGVLIERRSAIITAAVTGQIDVRGLAEAKAGEQ